MSRVEKYISCTVQDVDIVILNVIEKKPVRFPRNPSFNDILLMLEEKRKEKQRSVGGRKLLEDTFQERSGTEEALPALSFDVFF